MRKFAILVALVVCIQSPLARSFTLLDSSADIRKVSTSEGRSASPLVAASSFGSGEIAQVDPATVGADDLRSIRVTNANGELVPLGDSMGSGTSIVVFLRHLGCTWCWSEVEYWREVQDQMVGEDITGPIFVSIGDELRLNQFLDEHPDLPRESIFVDGYDFAAFKEAGFGRFDEKPEEVTKGVEAKPIRLGGLQGWRTFLSNFLTLAPYTEDMTFKEKFSPEGLLWVGGTFVVRGNEIVYRYDDRISGDHPEATEVLAIAKEASKSPEPPKGKPGLQNLFGLFD